MTLTAVPANDYAFLKWTGETLPDGIAARDATISFAADASYALVPLFVPVCHVQTGGSDDGDGSQTAPFATINHAVTSSPNGAKIYVGEGVFHLGETLNLGAPFEIIGAGRERTVICCAGILSDSRSLEVKHPDAVVRDLTIANCPSKHVTNYANDETKYVVSGGVLLGEGLLANLRVTEGAVCSEHTEVKGTGLLMTGGIATNCLIEALTLKPGTGNFVVAGYGLFMDGGLFVGGKISRIRTPDDYSGGCHGLGACIWDGTMSDTEISLCAGKMDNGNIYGAGVYLYDQEALAERIKVIGNMNGVNIWDGTLRNALVVSNSWNYSKRTAGIYQTRGRLVNCTVFDNEITAPDASYADSQDHEMKGGTAVNNIIGHTRLTALGDRTITFTTNLVVSKTGSDVLTAGSACTNVLSDEPNFNPSARYAYHLTEDSPAINAGDNGVWAGFGNPIDLAGNKRIRRKYVDLGCFEFGSMLGFFILLR